MEKAMRLVENPIMEKEIIPLRILQELSLYGEVDTPFQLLHEMPPNEIKEHD